MLEITRETQRAVDKHGVDSVRTKSWMRVGNILGEESGEVQQAIIQTFNDDGKLMPGISEPEGLMKIYKEALQTASVAIRIMHRIRARAAQIKEEEEQRANKSA